MEVGRTRAAVILVAVAVVGALSGWLWSRTTSSHPATTTTTAAAGATTTSRPAARSSSTTTTAPARAAGDTGSGLFFFRSPSDNISCLIEETAARCDIRDHSWSPPPKPSECDLDWGGALQVSANGAGFICAGDTAREDGEPVLPYGGTIERGDIRCTSAPDGMTCAHRPSGHGFRLARETFDLS